MNESDLADIDRELEILGSVPAHLSRIVARYGGWGLELDEVDEALEIITDNAIFGDSLPPIETAHAKDGGAEPVAEFDSEPEAEVIAGDPDEIFQDDIDERVAQEVFVEAESNGLIQRVSEPPEVSASYETPNEQEPEQVEYAAVLPEELTPIDKDVLDLEAAAESGRHSFAEFIDEGGQESTGSSDESASEEGTERAMTGEQEFDAVYFHEAEEELPATEELRAYRDPELEQYDGEAPFTTERPAEEHTSERSLFRDSEYKRLLELELDPSDFPQSEPPSRPPPADDEVADEELEALDDDDIVEIEDDDIEISDETDGVIDTVDDPER